MNQQEKDEHNIRIYAEVLRVANKALKEYYDLSYIHVLKDVKTGLFYAYGQSDKLWIKDWRDAKIYHQKVKAEKHQKILNKKSKGKLKIEIEDYQEINLKRKKK